MNDINKPSWERFQKYYFDFPSIQLALDLSRMPVDEAAFARLEPKLQAAYTEMDALERGGIANPDENRMVGHYWLRNPALAPTKEIRAEIEGALADLKNFVSKVHAGEIKGSGGSFKNYLLIGIGGSALGPQFVTNALGNPESDFIKPYFFDNTDPDGMNRVLEAIGTQLNRTLCIVISKSGGTKETRNGMIVAKDAFRRAGLDFGPHAVAVTSKDSDLDKHAITEKWLARFPMWDWVGGRTSVMSAVGLLPAAMQGFNVNEILNGAKAVDILTRRKNTRENPAALLALAWFEAGNGNGSKNMVILPYKDRLELFSKYLQQLIMESLGKELDRSGAIVNQGISVFGNKGATDQHSYIQQLRDGLDDYFATFIEVLSDGKNPLVEVESGITSGDFLQGFLLGTRQALSEKGRNSITITINEVSAYSVGVLIALYERAVGFYASMTNINAYHQPGVEAGKKAAGKVVTIQKQIIDFFEKNKSKSLNANELADSIGHLGEKEIVFKVALHLAHRVQNGIRVSPGASPEQYIFSAGA